jgi:hypothetical protein
MKKEETDCKNKKKIENNPEENGTRQGGDKSRK